MWQWPAITNLQIWWLKRSALYYVFFMIIPFSLCSIPFTIRLATCTNIWDVNSELLTLSLIVVVVSTEEEVLRLLIELRADEMPPRFKASPFVGAVGCRRRPRFRILVSSSHQLSYCYPCATTYLWPSDPTVEWHNNNNNNNALSVLRQLHILYVCMMSDWATNVVSQLFARPIWWFLPMCSSF